MVKKKGSNRSKRGSVSALNRGLNKGFGDKPLIPELQKAKALMGRQAWEEAAQVLENLSRSYPENADVLSLLGELYSATGNLIAYQRTCHRLLEQNPYSPEIPFILGGLYLNNQYPLLALKTFKEAIAQWSESKYADRARKAIAQIESMTGELIEEAGLTEIPDALEILILYEQGQAYLAEREYERSLACYETVLSRAPNFVASHNNLSLIYFVQGNIHQAFTTTQAILENHPDNVHALANLIHYGVMLGETEVAKTAADRLKQSEQKAWDNWSKRVEGLSFLGDGEGVLQLFKQAQAAKELEKIDNPLFFHLVGVAAMQQDDLKLARQQWQKALKINPNFTLAKANLEDLKQLPGQHHAPWPFDFNQWISPTLVQELFDRFPKDEDTKDRQIKSITQAFVQEHPYLLNLVPVLLDRGDPAGRQFAVMLANLLETPEMLTALQNFALSRSGTDQMRYEALLRAAGGNLPHEDSVRMWIQGTWQEIRPIAYEFHNEPLVNHSPAVHKLLHRIISLLHEETPKAAAQAETLLQEALSLEPDAPDLVNNLAVAYKTQGNNQESFRLHQQLVEQHPNYVFGRVGLAQHYILQKDYDRAEAILRPIISFNRFNFQEFDAFSQVYIQLFISQGKIDQAVSWFKMWQQVSPEHPQIQNFQRRLNRLGGKVSTLKSP